jgi:hypothetical protein
MTLVERLMNEVTAYGGIPMRRGDVAILAAEHLGDRAGEPFGAQYFAFHGPAVDAEPWPLERVRALMQEA